MRKADRLITSWQQAGLGILTEIGAVVGLMLVAAGLALLVAWGYGR